jgi:intracellular multiplication protein IcmO
VDSFSNNSGGLTNSYADSKTAKTEKRSRIDLLDLKDQREGEAHMLFRSSIVRAKLFYANPAPCKDMQLNQFLKVDLPKDQELYTLVKGIEDFEVLTKRMPNLTRESDPLLETLFQTIAQHPSHASVALGIDSLVRMMHDKSAKIGSTVNHMQAPEGTINIFSPYVDQEKLIDTQLIESITMIARQLGMQAVAAQEAVTKWFENIGMSTAYLYPLVKEMPQKQDFIADIEAAKNILCQIEDDNGGDDFEE